MRRTLLCCKCRRLFLHLAAVCAPDSDAFAEIKGIIPRSAVGPGVCVCMRVCGCVCACVRVPVFYKKCSLHSTQQDG